MLFRGSNGPMRGHGRRINEIFEGDMLRLTSMPSYAARFINNWNVVNI